LLLATYYSPFLTPPPSQTILSVDQPAQFLPVPSSGAAPVHRSAPARSLGSPRTDPRAPRSFRAVRPFPSAATCFRYSCPEESAPATCRQSSAPRSSRPATPPAPSPAPSCTNHSPAVRKTGVASPPPASTNRPPARPSCLRCL